MTRAPGRSRLRFLSVAWAVVIAAALAACSGVGAQPVPTGSSPARPQDAAAPSAALRLVPAIWRVRNVAGESSDTWVRFDDEIDVIRPKGDVSLSWSTQGDAILTSVGSWSMTLGTSPPAVPWLTAATRFSPAGDGWLLTDAEGHETARLVRDGAPPPSSQALHDVPKVDAFLRSRHTDAVAGGGVHELDPKTVVGTWGLPGVRPADGSITLSADGHWSAKTTCDVLGVAEGGAGAYRMLPDGLLLLTEEAVAGTGCNPPAHAPPADAAVILDFWRTRSLAVEGARLIAYDRTGKRLGALQRER